MKKTVLVVMVLILALGAFGVGTALAQGQQPPVQAGTNAAGWMHDYVEQALASKLGLTEKQVEDALASGRTMVQIALEDGVVEADIPALLTEVHKTALDKAVADGVVTRQQADWMLGHMQGRWANGANGNCPMNNGTYGPQNGQGFRGGQGGMMGGRWTNQ